MIALLFEEQLTQPRAASMDVTLDGAGRHLHRFGYLIRRQSLDKSQQKDLAKRLIERADRVQDALKQFGRCNLTGRRWLCVADFKRRLERHRRLVTSSPSSLLNMAGRRKDEGAKLLGPAAHSRQAAHESRERLGRLFLSRVMLAVIAEEEPVERAFKAFDEQLISGRSTLLQLIHKVFVSSHAVHRLANGPNRALRICGKTVGLPQSRSLKCPLQSKGCSKSKENATRRPKIPAKWMSGEPTAAAWGGIHANGPLCNVEHLSNVPRFSRNHAR
jgi:hypothetical protein